MSKNLSYRFLILLIALAGFITLNAQDTISPADSVTIVTEDAPPDTAEDDEMDRYPDTLAMNYRSVAYDSVLAITTDKGFYYKRYLDSLLRASKAETPKQVKPGKPINLDFLGIIFWILAIGLFVFLVYKLFLSNSSILSRNRKNISPDISIEKEEDTNDPDILLRNAIRAGNYRLAVRYLYLQLLTRLADKKYIEISKNKTNYEYVTELRKHSFANEFASLTLKYEYVWYGEYPVDQKLFGQLQSDFVEFQKNNLR